MNDSMAQPRPGLASLELRGWKSALNWTSAFVLAALFLASGIWKITDPQGWAVRISELKFPESLSMAAALVFGIAETVGGALIVVPRFRRWGSLLIGVLLIGFMGYFAANYHALQGAECSCFPWIKRVVGPNFFLVDGLFLLMAGFAAVWSKPSHSLRSAVLVLGAVVVFALVSYGVGEVRQTGTKAPAAIAVNGAPYSLEHGKVFLFFFDPECPHCMNAAQKMSKLDWGSTAVVAVPVSQARFAPGFLQESGLKAVISTDLQRLKQVFPYTDVPAGIALENGREKGPVTKFEDSREPAATLQKLGLIR